MLLHFRRTASEFISSESGFVSPRMGLPMAWVVGLLLVATVVLTPSPVEASCGPVAWENCPDAGCAQYCEMQGGGCYGTCWYDICWCSS